MLKILKDNFLIKASLILAISTLVTKLLGIIFRVPLTNLLGCYGLGLYQTVFPVYTLLLELSGSAIPIALSKIISSKRENREQFAYDNFIISVRLLMVIGGVLSILLIIFSKQIATLQGNSQSFYSYITLAPAVFFVSIISAYRGYFQGLLHFTPTAISQIIEQGIKLIFGLTLIYILRKNIPIAVAGATLSISISEGIATLYLFIKLKKKRKNHIVFSLKTRENEGKYIKNILSLALPITILGLSLPLSQFLDSFIIVNSLKTYREDATSLYGIYSGVVAVIIGVPTSLCHAISTSTVPSICSACSENRENSQLFSLLITFLTASVFTILVNIFGKITIDVLFPKLLLEQKDTAYKMLKLSSANILFLSMLQTENSILIAKNRQYASLFSMLFSVAIKTVIIIVLIKNPNINIYSAVIGQITCYFVASLINLKLITESKNDSKTFNSKSVKYEC